MHTSCFENVSTTIFEHVFKYGGAEELKAIKESTKGDADDSGFDKFKGLRSLSEVEELLKSIGKEAKSLQDVQESKK